MHTPKPWKIYDTDRATLHVGTVSTREGAGWEYETICNMFEDVADNYDTNNDFALFKNAKANARLIIAAPDLLEALCTALPFVEDHEDSNVYKAGAVARAVREIRAAIEKATA
jgi:hypothetical protein